MINGVMIDCSRLMERHEYYFRLLDFMAQWGLNTLLLHFADDHGLGVQLPGFKDLAMPHAFTPAEIRKLTACAADRGIDIIPEIETFGHTRYLTDHPRYRHLSAIPRTKAIKFNAVDPLHPETHQVMRRLLRATARLFPSSYLHIGGDEVNLGDYGERLGIADVDKLWADYLNTMIRYTRELGKTPMFWADHAWNNARIAERLRHDAVAVWWRYEKQPPIPTLRALARAGFKDIVAAPSVACWEYRFLSGRVALANNTVIARTIPKYRLLGAINTVWCPYRYLQGAVYYGLAYGAAQVAAGGRLKTDDFNARFAREVLGLELTPVLRRYLRGWPDLQIRFWAAGKLWQEQPELNADELAEISRVNTVWQSLRHLPQEVLPVSNPDIWEAMTVAGDAAGLCSEYFLLSRDRGPDAERCLAYNRRLRQVRRAALQLWDVTRYPDDPQKRRPRFPNEAHAHALQILRRLPILEPS